MKDFKYPNDEGALRPFYTLVKEIEHNLNVLTWVGTGGMILYSYIEIVPALK